jgi:leucyl-tRNA synthetase
MAYDHLVIEPRWQKFWDEEKTFEVTRRPGHPKFYVLDMFPYPSGSGLHVGHPEGYTATDIVARHKRMNGFDVLHPMGWDAFGLPAEQHAINTGTHPAATTRSNIQVFKRQLKSLGFFYDWSREVDTTDPGYVRWTQWIFLKLFEKGLAFQGEIPVNWCPALGTVLSNEEVIDGKSERGGFPIERRPLRQWQLKITAYADRLADELEPLDWPETKQKQRDWIGKSEGAEVHFPLVGRDDSLTVYTTRPETLFGATYMVIAPDHPLTVEIASADKKAEVQAYADAARRKSDMERTALNKEKTGVLTGAFAKNPLNGNEIPIFTADYVLGAYGTGAIMAVPAHDERDFEFAQRFSLPIVEVVSPDGSLHEVVEEVFTGDGIAVRSGQFDGLTTAEMKTQIIEHLESTKIGVRKTNYKLRDWVFSRQRYWGEPIPIYFPVKTAGDPRKGDAYEIDYTHPIAVADSELPLRLPELEDYKPGDPQGPLVKAADWRFFQKDGAWFARETNTMPQWAGSCWYYLRYLDPRNDEEIFSQKAYDDWMPVDLYVGGNEHAVLHLLYARFWHKVLFDIGVVKHPEPFLKLVHQGIILGEPQMTGYRMPAHEWVSAERVRVEGEGAEEEARDKTTNALLEIVKIDERDVEKKGGHFVLKSQPEVRVQSLALKMSKSRGNVVNPDDLVREVGADSLRVYEMFMGPLEQTKPWQSAGIQGVRRFLDRVHGLVEKAKDVPLQGDTQKQVHRTVKKVGDDIAALRLNTPVSAMMILVNHLSSLDAIPREALEKLVLILSPYAPHLTEEIWQGMHPGKSVLDAPWPAFDPALCVDDVVEVAVQVNGKVRGRIQLAKDATEAEAVKLAQADENVQKHAEGKSVKKVIYVPGKILNLIVG